jgi:anti-sigma factor RsiW
MTRCGVDFERLSAFVDGELDPREELELRRHIERCDRCRSIVETLLATKAAVASTAEVRPVPHSLRERVSELVADQPRRRGIWLLIIPSLAAAMIVLVIAIYRPMFGNKSSGTDRLTRAMVEDHIHYLTAPNAIQVASDDPQQIAQAFADQFGFHLELPILPGANLLGGRLCWLHGRKAVLTFYQTSSGRFSLFVLDQQAFAVSPKRRNECTSTGGYEVCLVSRAPEVLAMVADKQQAELLMPELKKLAGRADP